MYALTKGWFHSGLFWFANPQTKGRELCKWFVSKYLGKFMAFTMQLFVKFCFVSTRTKLEVRNVGHHVYIISFLSLGGLQTNVNNRSHLYSSIFFLGSGAYKWRTTMKWTLGACFLNFKCSKAMIALVTVVIIIIVTIIIMIDNRAVLLNRQVIYSQSMYMILMIILVL